MIRYDYGISKLKYMIKKLLKFYLWIIIMIFEGFILWNNLEISFISYTNSCQNMRIIVMLMHDDMVYRWSFIL